MNVGIDVTGAFWRFNTGVQNYYRGILTELNAMAADSDDLRLCLVDRSTDDDHTAAMAKYGAIAQKRWLPLPALRTFDPLPAVPVVWRLARWWNCAIRGVRAQLGRCYWARSSVCRDLDVFHVWSWGRYRPRGIPAVITLYDMIPLHYPELYDRAYVAQTHESLRIAREVAAGVIAISEYTKKELVEQGGVPADRIQVIHLGVDSRFRVIPDVAGIKAVGAKYGVPANKPYALCVGYLDPRKNVLGHVRAFCQFVAETGNRDLHLVLAGPRAWQSEDIVNEVKAMRMADRIIITGYVSDDDLPFLMCGATVFLFCTLHEGFGLPALEAMACGVPVVTSNTTSMPEVAGDAALLVAPLDTDGIAAAIARLVGDAGLQQDLRVRGIRRAGLFTWRESARKHADVYRRCAALKG